MVKTIKARYSKGVIEPLEEIKIEEGKELTIIISEIPEKANGEDPLDLTAGAWAGTIDCEALKKNVYADRLISTRRRVEL